MKSYILLFLFFTCSHLGFSQKGIHLSHIEKNNSIEFIFTNQSNKTLFLFSSYFNDISYKSKYIKLVDTTKNELNISFLPKVFYLGFNKTDRLQLNDEKLISEGQYVYEFVELKKDSIFKLNIPLKILFKNYSSNSIYKIDFNNINYNPKDLEFVSMKDCNIEKIVFDFAAFKNIKKISSSRYDKKYNKFVKKVKRFIIISSKLKL